jgi:hypothetical protein
VTKTDERAKCKAFSCGVAGCKTPATWCNKHMDEMKLRAKEAEQRGYEKGMLECVREAACYIRANVVPEPLRGAITEALKADKPNILTLCAEEAGWKKGD